jgi:hypothetical protein
MRHLAYKRCNVNKRWVLHLMAVMQMQVSKGAQLGCMVFQQIWRATLQRSSNFQQLERQQLAEDPG